MNQRLVCHSPRNIELNSEKKGELKENEYLAGTIISAVSPGTELAWYSDAPSTLASYPYYPGYSMVAKVLEKGNPDLPLNSGDRFACRKNHQSQFVITPDEMRPISNTLPVADASAYRLASIALAGVRKAKIQLGAKVAVLGLGPIGNLAAQFAGLNGAGSVVGIDLDAQRIEVAKQCGIVETTSSTDGLEGAFDVVIEATGSPQPIATAFGLAKKKGTVILLATTREPVATFDFTNLLHRKMVTVVGAHESFRALDEDDFEQHCSHRFDEETTLAFLEAGRLKIEPLLGNRYSPANVKILYDGMLNRDIKDMIPLLDWSLL